MLVSRGQSWRSLTSLRVRRVPETERGFALPQFIFACIRTGASRQVVQTVSSPTFHQSSPALFEPRKFIERCSVRHFGFLDQNIAQV
jgi:hypothetical protein